MNSRRTVGKPQRSIRIRPFHLFVRELGIFHHSEMPIAHHDDAHALVRIPFTANLERHIRTA